MSNKSKSFVFGILCLGAGLFLIGRAVSVSSVWAPRLFGYTMPTGLVALPLLIGIGMLFYNHRGSWWKVVTALGVIFILLAVVLSLRITVSRVSLFDFILMFGFTASGVGLLLRFWFGR